MAKFVIYDDESDTEDKLSVVITRNGSSSSSSITTVLQDPECQAPPARREATPLPLFQLFIVALVRLADPIAYTQIFPYVNQMVEEMHITDRPSEIGFYSGLIDSLFAFAQLFTVYHWGRLSDRIGRRPVVLAGLTGVVVASSLFGLSNSLTGMLASRVIAGMFSGNTAVLQSIIGEITDETNQAKAFPVMVIVWSTGCVIGPLLGGLLSHPAERYPELFGNIQLLKDKPYFLPCFASSCLTVVSILLGYFFLDESLPRLVAAKKASRREEEERPLFTPSRTSSSSTSTLANTRSNYGTIKPAASITSERTATVDSVPPTLSLWTLLQDKKARAVLSATFFLTFTSISWDVVFILFAYTPTKLGGLSKHTDEIGYALACYGLFGIFACIVIFPFLHDIFGPSTLHRNFMSLWPLCFAMMPLLNTMSRLLGAGTPGHTNGDVVVWIGIAVLLVMTKIANMSFSTNMILIKAAAPNKEALGSMFGLAQSVTSVARTIGPAFVSSLFALSVERQVLGGNLVWIIMCGIMLLGVWNAHYLARVIRSSNEAAANHKG